MIFEALQASYGDCLFLTLDAPGNKVVRLLIDGGPGTVFAKSLEPRLRAEREELGLERGDPLLLDAVMVSHIDEDHILGILNLLSSLREADDKNVPRDYDIAWLLHNSFDALVGEGEGGAARVVGGETILAALGGADALTAARPNFDDHALFVLQSYPQGSQLSTLAAALGIGRNPPNQKPLSFERNPPRVLRLGDATLTIIGPLPDDIEALREEWKRHKAKKSSKAELAAYLDESLPNLSSIVAYLECNGVTALLTGDARGDNVLTGLKKAGLLDDTGPLKVDILKLPHHGSERNMDKDFFEQIHADHYVVSGDGTYGNPDRGTFEMLDAARPEGGFTIHMTFPARSCDTTHKEWRAKRPNSAQYKPTEHSLAGLFRSWSNDGKNITVNDGPVKIEL